MVSPLNILIVKNIDDNILFTERSFFGGRVSLNIESFKNNNQI